MSLYGNILPRGDWRGFDLVGNRFKEYRSKRHGVVVAHCGGGARKNYAYTKNGDYANEVPWFTTVIEALTFCEAHSSALEDS